MPADFPTVVSESSLIDSIKYHVIVVILIELNSCYDKIRFSNWCLIADLVYLWSRIKVISP